MKKEIQIIIGFTSPFVLLIFSRFGSFQINNMQEFTLAGFLAGISFIYIVVLISIIIDLSKWLFNTQFQNKENEVSKSE